MNLGVENSGADFLVSKIGTKAKEINKKVMTKKMQEDKQTPKNTLGDANEQLQELKDKMDGN